MADKKVVVVFGATGAQVRYKGHWETKRQMLTLSSGRFRRQFDPRRSDHG